MPDNHTVRWYFMYLLGWYFPPCAVVFATSKYMIV